MRVQGDLFSVPSPTLRIIPFFSIFASLMATACLICVSLVMRWLELFHICDSLSQIFCLYLLLIFLLEHVMVLKYVCAFFVILFSEGGAWVPAFRTWAELRDSLPKNRMAEVVEVMKCDFQVWTRKDIAVFTLWNGLLQGKSGATVVRTHQQPSG